MNMCKSNKRKTAPELCLKGQVFFIWSSYQSLETVKDRISLLGGKVDPFLSRDVTTVLVEDNHLIGSQPQLTATTLRTKPSYASNGTVVTSFPYQSSLCNIPSTSTGFNFLAASSSNSPYRVICYALQWGIQVLGIDQFLTWIEPQVKTAITLKKKTTESVSKLSGCFIKFESFYKNYRPCYKMFNNDPDRLLPLKNASVLVKPDNCNIVLDKPNVARQLHFNQISITPQPAVPAVKNVNLPVKGNDRKVQNNKIKPKEENNYCECCRTHFADLKTHIKSVKHQNFVSNEKNYEIVHNIIKMLPTAQEFMDKLQNPSPDPGIVVRNAEIPQSVAMSTITSSAVALNLQVQKDNVPEGTLPVDLHVERDKVLPVVTNNYKNIEDNPLPLDLVKRVSDSKNENIVIKQDEHLLQNPEVTNPSQKNELDVPAPKEELNPVNIKLEEPAEDMHCDIANGDPLFDRSTTAALAQLCLKNFDSYWLDTLPCEMDDMVFDDIFDIDDGKSKADNDCPDNEQYLASDMAQTPGLVSGISTSSFKTPTNTNMSFCINSSIDVKDIKSESITMAESFQNACKLEKSINNISSSNAVSMCETPSENKSKIFSIASYCANKVDTAPPCSSKMEVGPSCSNTVSNTNTELLFSSDSSDSEDENVLISNVLSIINTNSDGELKIDKGHHKNQFVSSVSGLISSDQRTFGSMNGTGLPNTVRSGAKNNGTENKNLIHSVSETAVKQKNAEPSNAVFIPANMSNEVKNLDKNASLRRNSREMSLNSSVFDKESIPAKKLCPTEIGMDKLSTINFSAVDLASNKGSIDSRTFCEDLSTSAVSRDVKSQSEDLKVCPGPPVKPLSFADMKMKISPKEVYSSSPWVESKFYENPVSQNKVYPEQNKYHVQDLKQLSIPAQNASSDAIAPGLVPNQLGKSIPCSNVTPKEGELKPSPVIPLSVSRPIKPPDSKQNFCNSAYSQEIKPKHDFSIAHLTSHIGHDRNTESQYKAEVKHVDVQNYHQNNLPELWQNSWQAQSEISRNFKNATIPSKDILSGPKAQYDAYYNSGSAEVKVSSEGCKAIAVLPKKAFGRKYLMYEQDKKQFSSDVASSVHLKMSEESKEKCFIPDQKSRVKMLEENSKLLGTTKNIDNKNRLLTKTIISSDTKQTVNNNITLKRATPSVPAAHPKSIFKKQRLKGKEGVNPKKNKVVSESGKKQVCHEGVMKQPDAAFTTDSPSHRLVSPVEPAATNHARNSDPKKSSSKLQQLPPLWSVSILPGNGVKLKFTCQHPQKLENQQCVADS